MSDVRVIHGDMREQLLALLADGVRVHSIVTDPPYHLTALTPGTFGHKQNGDGSDRTQQANYKRRGFMNQAWDGGDIAFQAATWRLCYDLLPPGGHMLCFGGTRTFHRLVCAIEDAGFEIRDTISWNFGAGFPKSLNVGKKLDAAEERCACISSVRSVWHHMDTEESLSGGEEQDMRQNMRRQGNGHEECQAEGDTEHPMPDVREVISPSAVTASPQIGELLQWQLPKQDVCNAVKPLRGQREGQEVSGQRNGGGNESSLERWSDLPQSAWELRQREVCPLPAGPVEHGQGGRLRDGASASDGAVDRPTAGADRNGASHRPSAVEQFADQSGIVAGQSEPQVGGAWPVCRGCGKPIVPDGLGTSLKPAMELVCVARKPLVGTVAANVLAHGTGALNIDATRIPAAEGDIAGWHETPKTNGQTSAGFLDGLNDSASAKNASGRWPANVCHDGSDEVVKAFPDSNGQQGRVTGDEPTANGFSGAVSFGGMKARIGGYEPRLDSGSAARFFYSARPDDEKRFHYSSKADADDRLQSRHPTIKPVDLLRWLVRLVTPPGGTVLDCFAGSGTTGMACMAEGFDCILIEAEAEYVADIRARIAHVHGEDTPLFSGVME
jgi:DNA modification methylase